MIYIIMSGAIFAIELWIKNKIDQTLELHQQIKTRFDWLILRKYYNRGAMLNLGENNQKIIIVSSSILCLVLSICFIFLLGIKGNGILKSGCAFLLGGAFSNTYDRLRCGHVIDYFSLGKEHTRLRKIVFNLADFCIIVGSIIIVMKVDK